MPMPKLPRSPWSKAFDDFCRVLTTDPDLRAVIKTWQVWDGKRADQVAATAAQLPRCEATLAPVSSDWETEGQHGAPLSIAVELTVPSTDARDLMDLWWVVVNAVYPASADRREAVARMETEAKVQITMTQHLTQWELTAGGPALVGSGQSLLDLYVSTRE